MNRSTVSARRKHVAATRDPPVVNEPFVRARALSGLQEVAALHGGNAYELLAAFDIDPSRLNDPDNPLPGNTVARLLEHAARTLDAPAFGLQLSEYHDVSVLGNVALVVLNSGTLGESLEAIAKNIRFHNPSARVAVTVDADRGIARYTHDPGMDPACPRRQAMELIFAIVFKLLRTLTSSEGSDWVLHFRHTRGVALRHYRQYFSCPIVFNEASDCILFPAPLLDVRIDRADPKLRALATRYLNQLQRHHPVGLRRQVAELVRSQLPNDGGRVERIAAILGLHPKTLQRRLKLENTTFQAISDEIRKSLAAEYLVFSFLPLPEVAALVGYSGQTAFIVACRRWFGVTPKKYRTEFLRRAARRRST